MGGALERLIGVARRILDSMLLQFASQLTHEVLSTFIAEVSAIMNARPITPIPSDPDSPALLTPATLLTQKAGSLPPLLERLTKTPVVKDGNRCSTLPTHFGNDGGGNIWLLYKIVKNGRRASQTST